MYTPYIHKKAAVRQVFQSFPLQEVKAEAAGPDGVEVCINAPWP